MYETQHGVGAVGTELIENEWVRLTRWDFPQLRDWSG